MYICGKCKKSRDQLIKEDKLRNIQGYDQCADCGGDLDHESVFKIEEIRENATKEAIRHNDYIVDEPSPTLSRIRGEEALPRETPNSYEYYPQWYKDHLSKGMKKINAMFSNRAKRKM